MLIRLELDVQLEHASGKRVGRCEVELNKDYSLCPKYR